MKKLEYNYTTVIQKYNKVYKEKEKSSVYRGSKIVGTNKLVTKRMVFENQTPTRKAQNMAALLAIILLLGIILPIPIGAGFADWINSVNAPDKIDTRFTEIDTFDFDSGELEDGTGYKPYFYWWNDTDASKNKHNVSMATYKLTPDVLSTDGNQYNNSLTTDDGPEWDNNFPYWEVYFNYTAKEAYEDNVVKFSLKLGAVSSWGNATGGKELLSKPDASDDDREPVTVTLSAGGVTLYKKTLSTSSDGDVEINTTLDINDLRRAIINDGVESYLKLKVTGHDARPIDMTGSALYSYNVNKLFGRDDGLYLVSMISVICAALGIFLVQPRYSLPFGDKTKTRKRGY
jgi:hypothetical protein